jgi:hypothetical protein
MQNGRLFVFFLARYLKDIAFAAVLWSPKVKDVTRASRESIFLFEAARLASATGANAPRDRRDFVTPVAGCRIFEDTPAKWHEENQQSEA